MHPDTAAWCRYYLDRGMRVIPVPNGQKGPAIPGWPDLRIQTDDIPAYFERGDNVGVLLGAPSGGLVDVDIDDDWALDLAGLMLPPTGLRHGRECRLGSHLWYRVEEDIPTRRFSLPDGTVIVEVRGRRSQSLVPPSVHPTGDQYVWEGTGSAARVSPALLYSRMAKLATAVVIRRQLSEELHLVPTSVVRFLRRLDIPVDIAEDIVKKAYPVGFEAEIAPGAQDIVLDTDLETRIREWFAPSEKGALVANTGRTRAQALRASSVEPFDGPRRIHEILRLLAIRGFDPRPSGDGFVTHCPSHDDKAPSLSIAETANGTVLLHCHAGCDTNEVLQCLDLEYRDLYPTQKRRRRRRSR